MPGSGCQQHAPSSRMVLGGNWKSGRLSDSEVCSSPTRVKPWLAWLCSQACSALSAVSGGGDKAP